MGKGSRAQGDRRSRGLGCDTADQVEKGSQVRVDESHVVWEGKPRREGGLRIQSPNQAPGEV